MTVEEMKAALADEEAKLKETTEQITELTGSLQEHRTDYAAKSATKLEKIELALPAQRAVDQVNENLWEIEQALQRDLSSKMEAEEQKVASEAQIAKLKADIATAEG